MIDNLKTMLESIENNYSENKIKFFWMLNKLYSICSKTIYKNLHINITTKARLIDECFQLINQCRSKYLHYPKSLQIEKKKLFRNIPDNVELKRDFRCEKCKCLSNFFIFYNGKYLCSDCLKDSGYKSKPRVMRDKQSGKKKCEICFKQKKNLFIENKIRMCESCYKRLKKEMK